MSKINLSTRGGQLSELEKQATVDLPTGEAVSPTPEPSLEPSPISLDQLMKGPAAQPTPQGVGEAVDAGVDAGLAIEAEAERQQVPNLMDRFKQAQAPESDRWLKEVRTDKIPLSKQPDGGINGRAAGMVASVDADILRPSTQFQGDSPVEGSFASAVKRAGAITNDGGLGSRPDSNYIKVASYVTENSMADMSFGLEEDANADPLADALGDQRVKRKPDQPHPIKQAQGNQALGNKIHQEYLRLMGNKNPDKLPPKEAAVVGQVFKDMWAKQNPNYVKEFTQDGVKVLQLTAEGQAALEAGEQFRKRLFPKQNVRPSKVPLEGGKLPGDVGQNVVKNASGAVGKPEFSRVIEQARRNLSTVPNVVDKQRGKILLSTILPVLQTRDHSTWMAEINNFGPSKQQTYAAARKDWERRQRENPNSVEDEYNPQAVMDALTDKIAQEVQAIAQERNGANYLTYSVQAFNGRISPQQSFFDPTTSKAVRFVTRNATPSIAKPGTRVERNLRQMYAMMLVKGADSLLPDLRDAALTKASPQLEAWGNKLAAAITMTDAQYETIMDAIAEGKPLNDPAYGEIPQLALDPVEDADLIAQIEKKEEDGPHFIDGLIDYAKYAKAKRNGQPYASYFNAYIDGKTNGIASNGIQMGHLGTAEATGVIRDNRKELLDTGDIRDQLKDMALASIDQGWDGNDAEIISELNHVARKIFSHRPLNKKTTMTFGYGKEISSFGADIEEAIGFLAEADPELADNLATLEKKMSRADLAKTLLNKYETSLAEVLSDDAIDSRALMRGAAALHAATNSLFSIKSYTGMDLNLGKDAPVSDQAEESSKYNIYEEGKRGKQGVVYHYETEATAAAPRNRTDAQGNVSSTPGDYAYGGSLPGPVQSLDAATVAMSSAGKSWDRLKMNSGGNPYMHSIYDAFKADANGFDVIVEEVNKNWMKAAGEWSYLQETFDATKKTMNDFKAQMQTRNPNEVLTKNERVYMDWMLRMEPSKAGNLIPKNLISKMGKFKKYEGDSTWKMVDTFKKNMASVGYNLNSPPEQPTAKQLKMFVDTMVDELQLGRRLQGMIAKTNTNKKKLIEQLKSRGYKTPSGERIALQYYAH